MANADCDGRRKKRPPRDNTGAPHIVRQPVECVAEGHGKTLATLKRWKAFAPNRRPFGVKMSNLRVRWHRLFGVYFILAALCLAGSCFQWPLWHLALLSGMGMLVLFVPLVMAIYFLRGLLRWS
jgi:hypothetical protein